MTTIEKHIVKFIDDSFGFPYLYYDKVEQTWANEFFLFDIKSGSMYVSDEVKNALHKKYGEGYVSNVFLVVINAWFYKTYKLTVKSI